MKKQTKIKDNNHKKTDSTLLNKLLFALGSYLSGTQVFW